MVISVVGSLCSLTVLWLTFQHKPGWYRPVVLDKQGSREAKADAITTADRVGDRMVEGLPFEVTLSDRSVNGWLAALPHAWPDAGRALPSELSNPAVRFDDHELRVGAHCALNGWQAIISLKLAIGLTDEGRNLTIALTGAYGGSLPVPRAVLERALEPLVSTLQTDCNVPDTSADPLSAALCGIQSVDNLYNGISIRNRFVWLNGDRPFRIESLTVGEGELRLRIEPL